MVCYHLWKWYVTTYGNGMLPFMEMVCYRLWKWYVTVYGNGMLPFMEMEGDYLGNRLWKRKEPVWATAYGNGRGLFGQPLMETEGGCLGNRLWKRKEAVWATEIGRASCRE